MKKQQILIGLGILVVIFVVVMLQQPRTPDWLEGMGGAANIDDDLIELNQPSR